MNLCVHTFEERIWVFCEEWSVNVNRLFKFSLFHENNQTILYITIHIYICLLYTSDAADE